MKKVIFTGCSFTAGNGWVNAPVEQSRQIECKDHPNLWTNLCHTEIAQLRNFKLLNLGVGGANNTEIFENTVKAIGTFSSDIDTIFCQWTSMPRYTFPIGLELWSTTEGIQRGARSKSDVNLSDGTKWTREHLDDLLDRLNMLHHLHGEILKVVKYTNILKKISVISNIKIYFLNGLCPWDNNYFVRLNNFFPKDLTPFTKKNILSIDSRSDIDIFKLYKTLHDEYDREGGINTNSWINLYSSMLTNILDTNYDNQHPGVKSNQLYFQQVKSFLEAQ